MVNAAPNFGEHPKGTNGCSDLMMIVFGLERRPSERSAVEIADA
jgi:hypothetical protein